MATSSIYADFTLTKKESAKRFVDALTAPASPMKNDNKINILSKNDAIKCIKRKTEK